MSQTKTTFRDGEYLDLACERLGGRVLAANDEFFAAKENLIRDGEAVWDPDLYVETGKWMDGWESRRRRPFHEGEHDWCLLQLGRPGILRQIVVDTSHFTGNYPEACSIDAINAPESATPEELLGAAGWWEILPRTPLLGDEKNRFPLDSPYRWTHLRLNIYPDGGVARLRVLGEILPEAHLLASGDRLDLAALTLGARIDGVSDRFYSAAEKMLLPDEPQGMFDGWETRRRRGPGNDWAVIRLAAEGVIERAEVDTRFFKGNAPGHCSLEGLHLAAGDPVPDFAGEEGDHLPWQPLLQREALSPHREHAFDLPEPSPPCTHVRLQIYPDGGVARIHLYGRPTEAGRKGSTLAELNALPPAQARERFLACCGSHRWAQAMADARPFEHPEAVLAAGERVADNLGEEDWRQAFAAHPRIGGTKADRPQGGAPSAAWSRGEQAGVTDAGATTRARLAAGNRSYEEKFGYLYLVCATGKSAAELLQILEGRLGNTPEEEFSIAVHEQRKITRLRLEKLLLPSPAPLRS